MVEGGMPPMKAIQSATREAARLLKIEDRLGTLEEKKLADVVAVEGNPLEDIRAMRQVVFVMKEGVVFKNGELGIPATGRVADGECAGRQRRTSNARR